MGHSDLQQYGICLFLIILHVFYVLVETTKSLILFLLYNCSPDTFSISPSSGTCLISVGR